MTHPGSTRWPRSEGFLARWAAIGIALCVVDALLSALVRGAPFRVPLSPPAIKWALVAEECLALFLVAGVAAIPRRRRWRLPLLAGIVILLVSGWSAYVVIGRFPDIESIRFFFTVPGQAVQHGVQLLGSLMWWSLMAGLALLLLLEQLAGVVTERATSGSRRRVIGLGAALAGTALVGLVVMSVLIRGRRRPLFDPETGVTVPIDRYWHLQQRANAGPISTLVLAARDEVGSSNPVPPADPSVPVFRPERKGNALGVAGIPKHRWNVLVIEIESLRSDALRAWGNGRDIMPTVDAIASGSRRYRDTYTTATQTDLAAPVPLSGQYPLRDDVAQAYPKRITYPRVLLYDLLGPAGWRTAVFSSQNESWWGMENFLRTPSLGTFFHSETFAGPTLAPKGDLGFWRFVRNTKRAGKIDDHDTVGEAINWLDASRSRPFLLYLNLQASHLPYVVPTDFHGPFGHGKPSFPILFGNFPRDSAPRVRDVYDNALNYVDQQIARVRASLQADGRWDSTLVVITGDHGQAFFEHDVAGHANGLWQELVRVPLVLRAPGLEPGDDFRPASHVDVAPTVAALMGLPPQPAWQGISLTATEVDSQRPRFLLVQSPLAHEIGVVKGRWKFVEDVTNHTSRLTDLVADPGERQDVAAQWPDTASALRALVDTWRAVQLDYYRSTLKPAIEYPPRVGNGAPE